MQQKRQLVFVQGGGKGAHDAWDSKLVASLRLQLGQNYQIHYPRMPREDEPKYGLWKSALESWLAKLPDSAILIGHSLGAPILLKALVEQPAQRELGAIFLIAAPFVGAGGWSADELELPADLGALLPKDVPIHFYHGLADDVAPPSHVELYARAVPQAQVHRLSGRDHQLNDDLSEIAAAILSLEARH